MNLSLRRRQGNHVGNDPHGPASRANNNAGVQDRKNIVSMISAQPGEVKLMEREVITQKICFKCLITCHFRLEHQELRPRWDGQTSQQKMRKTTPTVTWK